MRRPLRVIVPGTSLLALLALLACGTESPAGPSAPEPGPPADLSRQAFQVILDIQAGRATVIAPAISAARAAGGSGPSFSIIGSEGVELHPGALTCTVIPRNREQKRCSFDLSLGNRFREIDLMTPTSFPKPPAGVSGVLMFPLTAAADAGSGPVVPSPDWDYGPINFFNDFGSCSAGTKSDCVRYETIASPFYAQAGSGTKRVGFDVPVAAQRVTTYVVVAADLRENPIRTFQSPPILDRCGSVGQTIAGDMMLSLIVGAFRGVILRGFCTFNGLPTNVIIRSAVLRMHQEDGSAGDAGVEYLEYGETVDFEDFDLPATHTWHKLNTAGRNLYLANVTAEVQEAYASGAGQFPFRFSQEHEAEAWTSFAGWVNIFPSPVLELTYSLR
jgi:hypothetical protein